VVHRNFHGSYCSCLVYLAGKSPKWSTRCVWFALHPPAPSPPTVLCGRSCDFFCYCAKGWRQGVRVQTPRDCRVSVRLRMEWLCHLIDRPPGCKCWADRIFLPTPPALLRSLRHCNPPPFPPPPELGLRKSCRPFSFSQKCVPFVLPFVAFSPCACSLPTTFGAP